MEKAEQQLQKKLDRRGDGVGASTNRYKNNEASASQVISKKDARAEAAGLATKDVRIENFDIAYGTDGMMGDA